MKGLKSAVKWIVAIVAICAVMVFLGNINGLDVSRSVAAVNGSEISEGEYKFYLENAKLQVLSEQGITEDEAIKEFLKSGTVEGKAAADYIRDKAITEIIRTETAVVKAKEAGITLTDEEISTARSTESVKETIKSFGISEKSYADVMEKSQLVSKYFDSLSSAENPLFSVTNDEIYAGIDKEYSLVQHVLVLNKPEGSEEVDENYVKEAKAKAEDVLKKATGGTNFASLINEYNEDPGMENSPEGYLITKEGYTIDGQSQMVPEFTKAAFAVNPKEVYPELVESSYGYHILRRCEITEGNGNYSTIFNNVRSSLLYDKFEQYLDSLKDSLDIVKKDSILNKAKVKY